MHGVRGKQGQEDRYKCPEVLKREEGIKLEGQAFMGDGADASLMRTKSATRKKICLD